MASVPLKTLALVVPALFAFGFVLDEQRLVDRTPIFAIDHEMDARLTVYVPLVQAAPDPHDLSESQMLTLGERWREGLKSGQLRDPMPARYGDNDGPRSELVAEAIQLSAEIGFKARHVSSRSEARRLYAAAVEPLRAVQYADVSTLMKIEGRRRWMVTSMGEGGVQPEEIARMMDVLKPDPVKLDQLFRHMMRLRNRYRVRFGDDEALWAIDPYFEKIVRGKSKNPLFAQR